MSPTVLVLLVAGTAFVVFLLLALIVWSIRIRRAEDGFEPAPPAVRKSARTFSESFSAAEQKPAWLNNLAGAVSDTRTSSAGPSTDQGSKSLLGNLMRGAMPEISTLLELGKMVRDSQAAGDAKMSAEERNAAFHRALDQMLEERPEDAFLQQLRASLPPAGDASAFSDEDSRVQVFQLGGKTAIRVDGVEVSSADEISDPALREKVRRLLEELDRGEAFLNLTGPRPGPPEQD
jgi:hypothetical protein